MATSGLPVPAPMDTKGDLPSNWQFFKQQWADYEVATELKEKDKTVRIATLRSIMGKECLKILQTLSMSEDEKKDPDSVVGALEKYFTPKTMLFMKDMCLVPQTKVPMRQLTSMSQD